MRLTLTILIVLTGMLFGDFSGCDERQGSDHHYCAHLIQQKHDDYAAHLFCQCNTKHICIPEKSNSGAHGQMDMVRPLERSDLPYEYYSRIPVYIEVPESALDYMGSCR